MTDPFGKKLLVDPSASLGHRIEADSINPCPIIVLAMDALDNDRLQCRLRVKCMPYEGCHGYASNSCKCAKILNSREEGSSFAPSFVMPHDYSIHWVHEFDDFDGIQLSMRWSRIGPDNNEGYIYFYHRRRPCPTSIIIMMMLH